MLILWHITAYSDAHLRAGCAEKKSRGISVMLHIVWEPRVRRCCHGLKYVRVL